MKEQTRETSCSPLESGIREILTDPGNAVDKLYKYIREIELFNDAYGLVKAADRNELIVKHILDSIAPVKIIENHFENIFPASLRLCVKEKLQIADVGSGAGLPGIPLAICMPQTGFTLIERMGRRAGFLRNCAAVLELSNVTVEETEMEKADPGRFDAVVFRAFRPLTPDILKGLFRLPGPRGFLAAWKGRHETALDEIVKAGQSLPEMRFEIKPVYVPCLDGERCLVLAWRT